MTAEKQFSLSYEGFSYNARVVGKPHPPSLPVVLLGGALMDMLGWRMTERHLSERTTVVTVDLPGQGTSDPLPAAYGLRYLSASVAHLVKHLGLGRVNLVGTSFGSTLAYAVARIHPEIVSHMVLVGFGGKPTPRARKLTDWTCAMVDKGMPNLGHRFATSILNHDPSCSVRNRNSVRDTLIRYYDRYVPGPQAAATLRRALGDSDLWEAGVTGVPALLVCGEHDHLVPPSLSRRACSLIEDARFVVIKEADHVVHLERPAELAEVVLRFCDGASLDALDYLGPVEQPYGDAPPAVTPLRRLRSR
ncbi:alpha/beta fold hydrolase [Streptomyces sp. DH12]|uniref:alpha/beta fold hydrolase n=1 Tax=Streptomyces sp. DH12 TaxID=2857010 RepID=UPI001E4300C6|nr:alpha/beta hydrolase [Streptomyces sp. DH12]